ncbi:ABC transporter ATP-binding protein [Barrientosiimonas humi]|uniref:ABC transporter ATP-binding protein n=1 Tax=Barrientosiimonas humi TaxID=999931 RepID=UPI00370DA7DB
MHTTTAPSDRPAPIGADTNAAAVVGRGLVKTYGQGDAQVVALDHVDVAFGRGRFTAIMGPSGSGKSTLMHCLAGLDTLTAGEVVLGGRSLTGLSDDQLTRVRRDHVGFVFQSFNLLPTLSAADNVRLPLRLAGQRPDPAWWDHVIGVLGLGDRLQHRPSELSGGQQQRVAVARALISRPAVVFADEPTGALDSVTGAGLLTALRASVHEMGQTVVMVTHDPGAAAYADRVVLLADGRLQGELQRPTADTVLDALRGLGA